MTSPASLLDKVAIVTGGSRGIGLATARALSDRGAAVVISGLNESHLARAKASLGDAKTEAVRADVRELRDVERLVQTAVDRFGGLDILINNAGVGVFGHVAELSIDDWHKVMSTNLTGVFYCCRGAIPHLRKRGGGWIINVSSLAGKNSFAGGAAYCATKAGLNAFSEALMQELRYDGIRVSYVMPGSVRTGFTGSDDSADLWKLSAEDVAQVIVDLIHHPARSLPSRVEMRPAQPPRK